jgi:DNA-binding beta-propeller fold protein YncE
VWTANEGSPGSVSKVDPDTGIPTITITTGFTKPIGILYDGANTWVTDLGDNKLKKLDSNGNILQSVPVGSTPELPVFDGNNIWCRTIAIAQ